jgi:hypothetical protein
MQIIKVDLSTIQKRTNLILLKNDYSIYSKNGIIFHSWNNFGIIFHSQNNHVFFGVFHVFTNSLFQK